MRVGYAQFPAYSVVVLVSAYSKGEQDDLSVAQKQGYRQVLARIEKGLAQQQARRKQE